jgi:kynureninase
MDFFEEMDLTPQFLRDVSQHQVGALARAFDALDADTDVIRRDRSVPLEEIGGFLSLSSPRAETLSLRLGERGVHCDYRGDLLRLGPAPYLSDQQLRDAMDALGKLVSTGVSS